MPQLLTKIQSGLFNELNEKRKKKLLFTVVTKLLIGSAGFVSEKAWDRNLPCVLY